MIKGVIFDLDGLLVDSEPVWFRVRTAMCEKFGLTWTDEDQKGLMGRSTQTWIDFVTEKLQGNMTPGEVRDTTIGEMTRSYQSGLVPVMPGAQEALTYCSGRLRLGLASGSPTVLITAALDACGWKEYFEVVVSSDDVPNGKPAPDVYLEVMSRLSLAPDECAVVEDSGSGLVAGRTAGAYVIAVPTDRLPPPRTALDQVDAVLASLEELPEHLSFL